MVNECPSMWCRVIAWEPVPLFAAFLQYGLLRNNLTDRVQVVHVLQCGLAVLVLQCGLQYH